MSMGKYSVATVTSQDIEKYMPLVHKIVNQLNLPPSIRMERDDLISIGMFGLIDAFQRFDVEKKIPFEKYAYFRIKGVILDEIRKMGFIPRKRIDLVKAYLRAEEQLIQQNGRKPTDEELGLCLNWPEERLKRAYETLNLMSISSLEALLTEEGEGEGRQDCSKLLASSEELVINRLEREAQYEMLHKAIDLLPEREKQLLQLHYVEGLNFNEISEVLGCSPSRISQLFRQSLSTLRIYMKR